MLVLNRKVNEAFLIGDDIVVKVVAIEGKQVKIGIQAPDNVVILRTEIANQPVKKGDAEED